MEYWDVYDKSGKRTGKIREKGARFLNGEYHLAIELWIKNSKNQILIQKRSEECALLPGVWALTTGRMVASEDSDSGCIREAFEELGIRLEKKDLIPLRRIFREDGMVWDIYLVKKDFYISELTFQKEEVADAKWVDFQEFQKMLSEGTLFFYPEIPEILADVTGR